MKLYESSDTYLELIQATAADRRIPAVYVEKDYWVTRILKRLHESAFSETVVFKGGTSLSKAHRLIERFSEDIDLALRWDDNLSGAQNRKLIKAIERAITQELEYQPRHPRESKHGRFRKTAHAFPTWTDAAELGQVTDTLLIEINSFANPEPKAMMPIATLIHDFLMDANESDLVRQYELEPFEVLVLGVERTLCEKIMGLVRAGHEAEALAEFRRRIRHFYDIVMIMRERKYQEFVASDAFAELIAKVGESDRQSMPNASTWVDSPLTEAMILADTENLWRGIRSEFHGSFKDMVYGDTVPDDDEVLACFSSISASLART